LENEQRELEKIYQVEYAQLESEISKLTLDRETLAQKMKRTDEVNENIFYRIWRLNEKRIRKVSDIVRHFTSFSTIIIQILYEALFNILYVFSSDNEDGSTNQ
jgi:hypothetical protein